ncbi:hypothetical protein BRARA_A02413, partial [Brassica rapa]
MSFYFDSKEWMDQRIDPESNSVSEVFLGGINAFLQFACNQADYVERKTLLCPCARCKNVKQRDAKFVSRHLFLYGFKGNYYVWTSHGEKFYTVGESSGANHSTGEEEMWENPTWNAHENHYQSNPEVPAEPREETEVAESYRDSVFEAFEAASQPLYEGCADGITQLSLASRMMKVKTNYNLVEACVDEISETKKLTRGLGLTLHKIDVCVKNCMLFWKEDANLVSCKFCREDRYYPNNGKGKNKPQQRMFYLPIADRLKRMYQLEATASNMRWHKEHVTPEGEMHHPSDAIAWKHFNEVYPGFAAESRNIYLCLSTDGFNPIGMSGEAHSLWPVIVTSYNLPPGMYYYGLIQEIMMVEYHGDVGLKVMVFKCSWFDTTENRGMRIHPFGLVDVSLRRQYAKYDPFVLLGNCDQACFIPYPRIRRQSVDDWWACAKIFPRGIRETSEIALTAWQDNRRDQVAESSLLRVETHVVDDVSDYDITPVNPQNDEYVSDGDVEADRD